MTILPAFWQARRFADSTQRLNDQRSPYQKDKARILHSAAFRRLQSKTQVLGVGMNDFYRTRLTHSLEAAQIGTGINGHLRRQYPDLAPLLDDALIEALCLAHDIGHPPYGHGGEVALNYMMRDHGGFEGNGQTFRILTRLEPYTESHGMNLARRTLLGVLKYPVPYSRLVRPEQPSPVSSPRQLKARDWQPAKGLFDEDSDVLDWVLTPLSKDERAEFQSLRSAPTGSDHGRSQHLSLDATIMELADDIAYSVHDMEDALVLGIVQRDAWQSQVVEPLGQEAEPLAGLDLVSLSDDLFGNAHHRRKDAIGTLVNVLVTQVSLSRPNPVFNSRLLAQTACLAPAARPLLERLKAFVYEHVIQKPEVQMLEYKGQQIIMDLFEALESDPERLLPAATRDRWRRHLGTGQSGHRVIADYIAGMTDEYAARLHENLFTPHSSNPFELPSRR